jgi:hypothetical protein
MDRITTIIKREWLRKIVAGTKRTEYRELKPYWTKKLATVETPFELRLINGMAARAPEVTVVVNAIRKNSRAGQYELKLGRILKVKHWNRRTEAPSARRARSCSPGTSVTAAEPTFPSPRRSSRTIPTSLSWANTGPTGARGSWSISGSLAGRTSWRAP